MDQDQGCLRSESQDLMSFLFNDNEKARAVTNSIVEERELNLFSDLNFFTLAWAAAPGGAAVVGKVLTAQAIADGISSINFLKNLRT